MGNKNIGKDIVEYIWGGFSIGKATLNRFYAIHYLLPFVLVTTSLKLGRWNKEIKK